MGLDVYAGTLTRYYARNWKTAVQQFGEKNGIKVEIFRQNDEEGITDPDIIYTDVKEWERQVMEYLSPELSETPVWNEDYDETPYYTDKPDWNALGALLLFTASKMFNEEIPESFPKKFDYWEHPLLKRAIEKYTGVSLYTGEGWWLPFDDAFMIRLPLPTGKEIRFGSVGILREELNSINSMLWNASPEEIVRWRTDEGFPTEMYFKDGEFIKRQEVSEYNVETLAKFAFSILWQAAEFAHEHRVLIIYDY